MDGNTIYVELCFFVHICIAKLKHIAGKKKKSNFSFELECIKAEAWMLRVGFIVRKNIRRKNIFQWFAYKISPPSWGLGV